MSRDRGKGVIAVVLFGVLVGGLAAWAWAGRITASQQDARDDLELFLDASSAGWAEVTKQFFRVPETAAETVGALSPQMDETGERITLLAEVIRQRESLNAAYVGYPDGSFYFVARSDEGDPGGFRTRIITVEDSERDVMLAWTDSQLRVVASDIEDDGYDPRGRPWFTPIAEGASRNWTAPYQFASSQDAGITHSIAVRDDDGTLVAVVGVDIRLAEVSEFLDLLSPRDDGEALVVDEAGQVIAESTMNVALLEVSGTEGELALHQSPELLELVEQFDQADIDMAMGRSADGLRTTVVRTAGARDEWYLAVRAVDDDFLTDEKASDFFEIFAVGVTVATIIAGLGLTVLRHLAGLKAEAEVDELTGIPNRRGITRAIRARLAKSDMPVRVAFIDLDEFKTINDEYGHSAGDAVLKHVATALRTFAEVHGAVAGRLGGDEFVIMNEGAAPNWAELLRWIDQPVVTAGLTLQVTASIGVAESNPTNPGPLEQLFGEADHQLFEAKRAGGATFRPTSLSTKGVTKKGS